ncbi:MAG: hypothetical protein MI725_10340 [Pirellulales bacterium]|nr:hypothetical protein [Pirellulales bacterium]
MIDAELLEVLRCPVDHSPLIQADEGLLEQINRGIAAGKVTNVGGQLLKKLLDGGLIRQVGDLLYPIVDNIPVMLPDEAVRLSQIGEDW